MKLAGDPGGDPGGGAGGGAEGGPGYGRARRVVDERGWVIAAKLLGLTDPGLRAVLTDTWRTKRWACVRQSCQAAGALIAVAAVLAGRVWLRWPPPALAELAAAGGTAAAVALLITLAVNLRTTYLISSVLRHGLSDGEGR